MVKELESKHVIWETNEINFDKFEIETENLVKCNEILNMLQINKYIHTIYIYTYKSYAKCTKENTKIHTE